MKLAYKVWLDKNGRVFGEGSYKLLCGVEAAGSLSRAAAEMGMSYNKAWWLIRTLEDRLGFKLLERRVGGISGGGSKVTPKARELMRSYAAMIDELQLFLDQLYKKHFQEL